MSLRQEFVMLALAESANVRELCRRFGISPKTGYKWLARFRSSGCDRASLVDHSRRPLSSPRLSPAHVQDAVVQLRQQHPTWGRTQALARAAGCPPTVRCAQRRHAHPA
ncbi:helix-turn-helix domain-containing protein [Diaphorobacter sp. HDW4A]|uniref:helix-turn-helix domain-containing protein n=1 Tax=Diaphorobacter sp. HDW4A TaxID=2714924 RepID=UPI0014077A4B|nr:helix-turn-helix domain-containing protein [Diaphorobacter sp. HDW4A]